MAISRAQLLKELLPGLNALFGLEYATYGEEHKEIYETETSERSLEEETKLSGFSAAPNNKQKVFKQYYPGSVTAGDIMAYVVEDPDTVFKVAVCSATTVIATAVSFEQTSHWSIHILWLSPFLRGLRPHFSPQSKHTLSG